MMKRILLAIGLATFAASPSIAAPKKDKKEKKDKKDKKDAKTPEQKEADRYFKSGVALFKEAKYAEALAEFERAYEIAPHPLVLYNIAGCHRELSHYAEAVKFYNRFLTEGKDQVPAARLATAQSELDGILARVARVTVTTKPTDGVALALDGAPLGTLPLDMPLVLPPGEHKLVASAAKHKNAERTIRVASGDEVSIDLALADAPAEEPQQVKVVERVVVPVAGPEQPRRFHIGAGFGTNLRSVNNTGAPALAIGVAVTSRLELGLDGLVVAYAVMPSIRLRLVGDAISLHLIAAAPISFNDGNMTQTFVAGALGFGLRFRATPSLAFRLDSFASYAGKAHGLTIPTFVGGELWF